MKKKIICEICGKEEWVDVRRRVNYCNSPECAKIIKERQRKEAMARYNAKHGKNKIENLVPKEEKVEPEHNNYERQISLVAYNELDVGEIRDIARELGAIRYQLIQLIEKERAIIENSNKYDDTLIHCFEFETLTKEEVWEKYLETQKKRTTRRVAKYRYRLLKTILDSILIKNPDKFMAQAINGCKNTRNFDEYVKELEKDSELFVQTNLK